MIISNQRTVGSIAIICRLEAIASENRPFPVSHFTQIAPPALESMFNLYVLFLFSFLTHGRRILVSVFDVNSLSKKEIVSAQPLKSEVKYSVWPETPLSKHAVHTFQYVWQWLFSTTPAACRILCFVCRTRVNPWRSRSTGQQKALKFFKITCNKIRR